MTIKEFAGNLNDREYRCEITQDEEAQAKKLGYVVVFGASDDLCELRGAIDDETGCYDGATLYISETGLFQNKCDNDDCPYEIEEREKCKTIEAIWGEQGYAWIYETEIPHATFEITEDGEKYCRGIVFDVRELQMEDNE